MWGARLAVVWLALGVAGCASIFEGYDVAPSGLSRPDKRLRQLLVSGGAASALKDVARKRRAAPQDEALRLLYEGLIAHYAAAYEKSNAAFERAADLADDRYAKSLSKSALSVLTTDRVLPYEPPRTERLLVHYYAALNYLRLGERDEAAVEARRLSRLLDRNTGQASSTQRLLRYFAGAVFEAAGEWNDAAVAYRHAGVPEDSIRFGAAAADSTGEIIVLVERGFVAHRVEQGVLLALWPEQVVPLRRGAQHERAGSASSLATQVLQLAAGGSTTFGYSGGTLFLGPGEHMHVPERRCETEIAVDTVSGKPVQRKTERCREEAHDSPYLLRVAWPAFSRPTTPAWDWSLLAGENLAAPGIRTNLSDDVIADFEKEQALVAARMILRATAKLAITKAVEGEGKEKEKIWRKVAGFLTNLGGVATERADTRSWHLLPAGLSIARVALPAGVHDLALALDTVSDSTRRVELGPVRIRAGQVMVLSTRVWN